MPIDNSTRFPKPLAADLRELSEGMAIVIDGDTAPKAIASGQYLFIKNHSTLATGGYHATAAIASGANITSSNVAADADGIVNGAFSSLSEQLTKQAVSFTPVSPAQTNCAVFKFNAYQIAELMVIEYQILVNDTVSSAYDIGSLSSFHRPVLGQFIADVPAHNTDAKANLSIIIASDGTVKAAYGSTGCTYYGTIVISLG